MSVAEGLRLGHVRGNWGRFEECKGAGCRGLTVVAEDLERSEGWSGVVRRLGGARRVTKRADHQRHPLPAALLILESRSSRASDQGSTAESDTHFMIHGHPGSLVHTALEPAGGCFLEGALARAPGARGGGGHSTAHPPSDSGFI